METEPTTVYLACVTTKLQLDVCAPLPAGAAGSSPTNGALQPVDTNAPPTSAASSDAKMSYEDALSSPGGWGVCEQRNGVVCVACTFRCGSSCLHLIQTAWGVPDHEGGSGVGGPVCVTGGVGARGGLTEPSRALFLGRASPSSSVRLCVRRVCCVGLGDSAATVLGASLGPSAGGQGGRAGMVGAMMFSPM